MSRPDVQAWLAKMLAEDPHGSEAAVLLSRLVVFVSSFDQGVIASVVQDVLTPSQRRAALATLQQWSFVIQTKGKPDRRIETLESRMAEDDFFGVLQSKALLGQEIVEERFMLNEGVVDAIVPDPQAHALHYQHYLALYRQPDPLTRRQFTSDWPNLVNALTWGYPNQPETTLDLYTAIRPALMEHITPRLASALSRSACKVARRTHNAEAEMRLLEALAQHAQSRQRPRSSRRYYRIALALYETGRLSNFFGQTHLLDILAELSIDMHDYPGAREFYDKLLPFYKSAQPLDTYIKILLKLNKLAATYEDLPTARRYAQEVLRLLDIRSRIAFEALRDLGMFYAGIDDIDNARQCYASAYAITDAVGSSADFEILSLWSTLEKTHGDGSLAYELSVLGVCALWRRIDRWDGIGSVSSNQTHDLLTRQEQLVRTMRGGERDA